MRLVTFATSDGDRPAALVASDAGDRLLELSARRLEEVLADREALAIVRAAVEELTADDVAALPLAADATLRPPVRPGKFLCLGYNYAGHFNDSGHVPEGADATAPGPEYPDVFVKTPNVLAGPNDPVRLPAASDDVDYEGEIAIVIGRGAHEVSLGDAMDHVAGYTLFNDVSARDWQSRSSQWELGKCFDGFGPLGPDALAAHRPLADGDAVTLRVTGLGELTTAFIHSSGGQP